MLSSWPKRRTPPLWSWAGGAVKIPPRNSRMNSEERRPGRRRGRGGPSERSSGSDQSYSKLFLIGSTSSTSVEAIRIFKCVMDACWRDFLCLDKPSGVRSVQLTRRSRLPQRPVDSPPERNDGLNPTLDVLITFLPCGILGPAAFKLGGVGLVGWAARLPFYLLRVYIGPVVLLTT